MSAQNDQPRAEKYLFLRKNFPALFRAKRACYRFIYRMLRYRLGPFLGMLEQYPPRTLCIPAHYLEAEPLAKPPTISIVSASLNQADYIDRTIQSILSQDYPRLEYIVHDGVSTDGTLDILRRYENDAVKWCSKPDNGQTDALNQAFKDTSGEIMAYLNTDDLLLPGSLNYIARFFQRHPDVDVIYGHRILIDENDHDIGKWVMPTHDDEVLRWVDYIPQETLFWRRALWEKVGGQLDSSFNFAMDWDLLLRFADVNARFARLPRYLGAFRVHPQQKTSSILDSEGRKDVERLQLRYHNCTYTPAEIHKQIARYLLKHLVNDRFIRITDFFRRKTEVHYDKKMPGTW